MLGLEYLAELAGRYASELDAPVAPVSLRGRQLGPWPDVALMGVVNLSRDSWYRESVVTSAEAAVRRGRRLATEGAHLIDLGAESTLPNAARADAGEQTSALLPVVRELNDSGILVSVETYDPQVARETLRAGAAVLNLTAGETTEPFYRLAAEHDAGVLICHVRGKHVREAASADPLGDHVRARYEYFAREIDLAQRCGVAAIWVDGGLGFYYGDLLDGPVRVRYQIETFLNTFRLRALGRPVCHALPHAFEYFEDEVRSAEGFFAVMALLGRTDLLRTHEIGKVRGVVETMRTVG